jgi:surfactin synthase thioesterase subunit/GNAT superfamily N-acetyltransferase
MSDLRQRLANLSPEKRALLEKRVGAIPRRAVVPRRQSAGPYPLSASQWRLWFLDQLEPGNPAYNVYRAVRILGPLDVDALGRSLCELLRRHEVLRTTYPVIDGRPVQKIGAVVDVDLPVSDLPAAQAIEQATAQASLPFRLDRDLLLRTRLYRLSAQEHLLALSTHHIAVDGWSVGILFRELAALYEGSPLAEPPIQFADYALWEEGMLTPAYRARLLEYWRGKLAGMPTALELPVDKPRPSVAGSAGARYFFHVPAAPVAALAALAQRENATLYMALLAAFKMLLAAYTGQTDIAVGSPLACRELPELEGLIGCFSNTLALRTVLGSDATFRGALAGVRATVLEGLAHELMPFDKLVQALNPPRDPSRLPLVQVNFRLLTAPLPPATGAGLAWEFLEIDNRHCKFDLAIELVEKRDGLGGYLEYSTDLFHAETMPLIAADYEDVLRAAAANPDTPFGSLGLELRLKRKQPGAAPPRVRRKPLWFDDKPAPAPCPPYELRAATIKDSAFLYDLRALTMKHWVSQMPGWTRERQEAHYMDFEPTHHHLILVDGKPVGAVGFSWKPGELRVLNLHLLPEAQGRGLGPAIMNRLVQMAHARGLPARAGILKINSMTQKMFQKTPMWIYEETEDRYTYVCFPRGNWVAPLGPRPEARLRLFCLPYAGGDGAVFSAWPAGLPASVEVCPILLPGRAGRIAEPLVGNMTLLVAAVAKGLADWTDRPFALFGHSTGALVAFELARRLEQEGRAPAGLFVSGCGAPQLPPGRPGRIHDLPAAEFLEQLRALGGTPDAMLADPELRDLMLPILRADFRLTETYRYEPGVPLRCPITAFTGVQDRFVSRRSAEAWRDQTTGAFDLRMLPSDHLFPISDRQLLLQLLASKLSDLGVSCCGPLS